MKYLNLILFEISFLFLDFGSQFFSCEATQETAHVCSLVSPLVRADQLALLAIQETLYIHILVFETKVQGGISLAQK